MASPLYNSLSALRASLRSVQDYEVARMHSLLDEGRRTLEENQTDCRYAAAWEMWVRVLLSEAVPRWAGVLEEAEQKRLLDDVVLLLGQPWRALLMCSECCSSAGRVVAHLLLRGFATADALGSAFAEADKEEEAERVVDAAIRLPRRLANALGRRCPLSLDSWSRLLSQALFVAWEDTPRTFAMAAAMAVKAGFSTQLAEVWKVHRPNLVASLDAATLEALCEKVFSRAVASGDEVRRFVDESFGPALPLSLAARRFTTGRLATGACQQVRSDRAAALVVRLLHYDQSAKVFRDALDNILALWADPEFVRSGDNARKRFVTRVALYCCSSVTSSENVNVAAIVKGVSTHLDSTINADKIDGMLVGEAFANLVDQKLHFDDLPEADRDDAFQYLGEVTQTPLPAQTGPQLSTEEQGSQPPPPAVQAVPETTQNKRPTMRRRQACPEVSVLSGSESEEVQDDESQQDASDDESSITEFEPYDLRDDGADLAPTPPPRCARDLLNLFDTKLDHNDARDRHIVALTHVERLVREHPADLDDVAAKLAHSLLHADNYFALPEFAQSTADGLAALSAQLPGTVTSYLVPHFFTAELSVSKRLCILDALCHAARELAGRPSAIDQPTHHNPLLEHDGHRVRGRRCRLKYDEASNASRWGYRRNPAPKSVPNRFGALAPRYFFFPLLFGYAQHHDMIKTSFSVLLKARVVAALCCFVDCSRATPVARALAMHLVAFAWPEANSKEPTLRRAALVAVLTALSSESLFIACTANPPIAAAQDPTDQLDLLASNSTPTAPSYDELLHLIDTAVEDDPDSTVREIATTLQGTIPRITL